MGFFKKLFGKTINKTSTNAIDSIGNLAKDIRLAIKNDIPADKRAELYGKILDVTIELAKIQSNVVVTEMQGNWLQRSWRPILMLLCIIIIAWNYMFVPIFHLPQMILPKELWTLLTIGVSGYIVGRSGEKIINNIKK